MSRDYDIKVAMGESLNETVQKLESLSGLGFWIIDLETKQNYWSPYYSEVCGFDLTQLDPQYDFISKFIHKEDESEVRFAIRNMEPFQLEARIIKSSGEFRNVILRGRVDEKNKRGDKIWIISCNDNTTFKPQENTTTSPEEFDSILEYSLDLIFIFDRDGVITKVSKSVLETLGYQKNELVGKKPIDFLYPSDVPKAQLKLAEIKSGKKIKNFKVRCLDAHGNLIYLNWNATLKEKTGRILGIARDITELVEEKSKNKRDQLKVQSILNSSSDLIWSLDSEYNLVTANNSFLSLIKKSVGWSIKPGDALLSDKLYNPEILAFWEKHYKDAFSGKKVIVETQLESTKDFPTKYYETKITPIQSNGEIKGLACFSRDITENKIYKERIKELNQRLLKGQELSKIGYWESDLKTNEVYWSDEMYKIWDIDDGHQKINFDFFFNSIHTEDRKDFLYHRNRALIGEKNLDIVYRIKTKKGNIKYIHELGEKDDEATFKGTAQEITKEKEYELKLKERNTFIESVLDNIPLGVAVNRISDGEVTYINKAFENTYGWPKSELADVDTFFEKVYPNPEYRSWIKSQIIQDMQSGDPERMNWNSILVTTKEKEEKIVNAKNIPAPDLNLMISTVIDDTERYLAEQALRVSNERFKLVSEAVSDAIWDWDINKDSIYWGKGFQRLFGYSEDHQKMGGEGLRQYIHPEDFSKIMESIQFAQKDKKQKYWTGEYRFKRNDGSYAFVVEKAVIIRDKKGTPIRMVGALQDTTKEKEKENHLKLLESVVTNTNDSILITKADPGKSGYEIIYCNTAFMNMSGYQLDEIIGKTPKILQGKDTDQAVLEKLKKDLKDFKSSTVELINYKKDGTPFWINMSLKPVADPSGTYTHWVAIQRDITERKLKEQELELMNERFRLISHATNDAIYDWDLINGEKFWGEGFSKLFGINLQQENDYSKEWIDRIFPEDLLRIEKFRKEHLLEKGDISTYSLEYRVHNAAQNYIYVLDTGNIIRDKEGYPVRMIGAIQDINKRKEYESSLEALNRDLETSNKQLEHSNKELEQFAYVASHDLQEPLRMISSFLGLIERRYSEVLDEKGKKYIHFAVDGAKRMKQIILDLLEFSKLDNFQESKTWLDTYELIDKAKLFINWNLRKKHTPIFHVEKLPDIFGHQSILIQLFQNIIANAIKYQPSGQTPEIWISCNESTEFWEFAIKDNGIGLEEEYLEKIFVIFQRLHSKDHFSGTGIGLAISKKIVDLHEGNIWAESKLGEGSTFFFSIKKPVKI